MKNAAFACCPMRAISPSSMFPVNRTGQTLENVRQYKGQHRTIASAAFAGSFAPILQFEKLEIHTVFLRFPNFILEQNLSSKPLAELCGVAKDFFPHAQTRIWRSSCHTAISALS